MSGISLFMAQLFPWAILAAMIAYVAIGVGRATLHHVDHKYINAVLLGLVLPTGAVVSLRGKFRAAGAEAFRGESGSSGGARIARFTGLRIQGLGNGFLFLVLVVSALITEMIDRNFGRAAAWCLIAAVFSWFGLMHSPDAALGRAADVRSRLAGRGAHRVLRALVARRS